MGELFTLYDYRKTTTCSSRLCSRMYVTIILLIESRSLKLVLVSFSLYFMTLDLRASTYLSCVGDLLLSDVTFASGPQSCLFLPSLQPPAVHNLQRLPTAAHPAWRYMALDEPNMKEDHEGQGSAVEIASCEK